MAKKAFDLVLTLAAVDKMTKVINAATANAIKKFDSIQKKSSQMAKASADFARSSGTLGVAAAGMLAAPIKMAMDFETAMLGVRKQVKGARDDNGKLTKVYFDMERQIKALTKEIPMTASEIAAMVTAGARMDIANENLIGFVRNAAKMATAFELPAGELADDMGKIAKIYGIPIQNIDKLGDAINFLDDNAISKGADIIDVLKRIGGTAKQLGIGDKNAAALASTMLTLGASAEVSATGANALMRELSIATMQPKRFQKGLQMIGMSAQALQKSMSVDAQGTILKVLDSLNKLPKEKQLEVTTQLFGKEYGDDIAKLAQGVEEYRRQLALLNNPKLQGSMSREFQARMDTSAAKFQIMSEQAKIAAINLGTALLPAVTKLMNKITPLVEKFAKWSEQNPLFVERIGYAVAAFAALNLGASAVGFALSGVFKTIEIGATVLPMLINGLRFAAIGIRAVGLALAANPIGAIITGIALAAWLIYEYWEPIKKFFGGVFGEIKGEFDKSFVHGVFAVLKNLNPFYWVSKMWGQVTEYLFGINLHDAGANIIQGLWNGISSGASKLLTNVMELAGDISNAFKSVLGIKSPSRVFIEHGLNITKGAAIGMNKGGIGANAGTNAGAAITPSFQPQLAAAGVNGGTISLNYAPVVNIGGGATEQDKQSFMGMLKAHERDILRMIEQANSRNERLKY